MSIPLLFVVILTITAMEMIFAVQVNAETAVLILARGGSKGIRLKNLQNIGDTSLLTRTILTAAEAGLHDVTVSTDNPLIALEGSKSGAKIFHRSRITATDWAPSIWGAAEFLAKRTNVDILVLLQATSPFVKAVELKKAIQKIKEPIPYDCVFAVTRSYRLRWKLLEKTVVPINFNINARPRRQDWDGELLEAGAFYIARRKIVMNGLFQNDNCTVWKVSEAESFEVDSYHDLLVANALLRSNLV